MKYTNAKPELNDNQNLGILIVNLGTPDAPNRKSLRKYLKEFLSDPRVVETTFPRWLWLLFLNSIILNIRPAKSAKSYAKIWQNFGDGSPLLDISNKQLIAIKQQLATSSLGKFEIELGMRYGNPSIPSAMSKLKQKGMGKLIVLPLYPQFSASTTASALDAVTTELQQWRFAPEIKFINQYYREPLYITALIKSIQRHWLKNGKPEKLLVSFHGIPKRYVTNGDPYLLHCQATTKLIAKNLGMSSSECMLCFQSIFGREEWLKPYTSETLKSLPTQGIKNVQIICPGFSADCLETLEEIDQENRAYFLNSGGEKFSYIPALNDNTEHIDCLSKLILKHQ